MTKSIPNIFQLFELGDTSIYMIGKWVDEYDFTVFIGTEFYPLAFFKTRTEMWSYWNAMSIDDKIKNKMYKIPSNTELDWDNLSQYTYKENETDKENE